MKPEPVIAVTNTLGDIEGSKGEDVPERTSPEQMEHDMETALESGGARSIKVENVDLIDESENGRLDFDTTGNVIDIKLESNDTENEDIENTPETTVESYDTATAPICPICKKPFPSGSDQCQSTHYSAGRPCAICGAVFKSRRKWHNHRLWAHRRRIYSYKCNICHSEFREKVPRDEHLKTHPPLHARRIYKCKICNSEFREKLQRDEHFQTHENDRLDIGITGNVIDTKFDSNDRQNVDLGNTPETTVDSHDTLTKSGHVKLCRICNKSVLYVDWCQDHHHLALKKCKQCGAVFKQKKLLYQHRMLVHRRRIFKCRICHSDFAEKSQRDEHLKTHEAQQCNICDAVLEPQENMEQHISYHVYRGRCFVCGEVFPSKSILNTHLRMAHEICCKKCGRKFYRQEDFRRHIDDKRAKNRCDFCCRGFWSWQELNSHILSHFPEEPTAPPEPAELVVSSSDVISAINVEIPDEEISEFNEEKISSIAIKTEIVKEELDEGFPSLPAEGDGINCEAEKVWKNEVSESV